MTAAYRVVVAERKDIAVVTIACEQCGSEVSIKSGIVIAPEACPSCGKVYGENTKNALAAFGRFQSFATAAEEHAGKPIFRFQMKQSD
jgi:predicted RNA-binding Zn-ribbon protein involved in translation (DUF1610 family)